MPSLEITQLPDLQKRPNANLAQLRTGTSIHKRRHCPRQSSEPAATMLNSAVLLFGNDDTSIALVDDRSIKRVVLDQATTIELSIEFPPVPVNHNDWWHVLRSDFVKFQDWWFDEHRERVHGFPAIVINLDAWWDAISYYNAWPTFERLCNFMIGEAHNAAFELKFDFEGEVGNLLAGLDWPQRPTRNQLQAIAKIRETGTALGYQRA